MATFVPQVVETMLDPREFFVNCAGLWVADDFRSRVVANAQPTKEGARCPFRSAELALARTDDEIEAGFPRHHNFNETEVCFLLQCFITKQMEGEEGELVSNGRANLFYMDFGVVKVSHLSGERKWFVRALLRDDEEWPTGSCVFFPDRLKGLILAVGGGLFLTTDEGIVFDQEPRCFTSSDVTEALFVSI